MNFERSKVILKKLNALHDSAAAFDGKFSALEKDLFLSYLRDLYEEVHRTEENEVISAQLSGQVMTEFQPPQVVADDTTPVIVEEPDAIVETPLRQDIPEQSVSPPVQRTPEPEQVSPLVREVASGQPTRPELAALFVAPSVDDLGSKFSMTPILDISRAMGINDRILMINQLFDGDQARFNQTINKLNSLNDFGAAQQMLTDGIADQRNWDKPLKVEIAKRFIHLVRRRYLSSS
ncbi:MAG: hypothetical protein AAFR14_00780 [Bacteroidota bacterium]